MQVSPISYNIQAPQQNPKFGENVRRQSNRMDRYMVGFMTGMTVGAAWDTILQVISKVQSKTKMNWPRIGIQAITFGAFFVMMDLCFEFFGKMFNRNR